MFPPGRVCVLGVGPWEPVSAGVLHPVRPSVLCTRPVLAPDGVQDGRSLHHTGNDHTVCVLTAVWDSIAPC